MTSRRQFMLGAATAAGVGLLLATAGVGSAQAAVTYSNSFSGSVTSEPPAGQTIATGAVSVPAGTRVVFSGTWTPVSAGVQVEIGQGVAGATPAFVTSPTITGVGSGSVTYDFASTASVKFRFRRISGGLPLSATGTYTFEPIPAPPTGPTYPASVKPSSTAGVKRDGSNVGLAAVRAANPDFAFDQTISQSTGSYILPSGTYTNVDFQAYVVLQGKGDWIFQYCAFSGGSTKPSTSTQIGVLRTGGVDPTATVKMDFCDVHPMVSSVSTNGFTGYRVHATACAFFGGVDDLEIYSTFYSYPNSMKIESGVLLDRCWMGPMHYESSATSIGGAWNSTSKDTHNDCCQIEGTTNGEVKYCVMIARADATSNDRLGLLQMDVNGKPRNGQTNSCFQIKPDVTLVEGWNIHDNLLIGGVTATNFASDPPDRALGAQTLNDNDYDGYSAAGNAINGLPITRARNYLVGTITPVSEYR